MSRSWREPFVHFLALGFLIFVGYAWLQGGSDEGEQIVVDQSTLDHLEELWSIQWKREPDAEETQALLERHLRKEVFYREALKLGLDEDDEIVKRRLSQKMEAVATDLGRLMRPPGDEELEEFLEDHPERFRRPQSFAFRQLLFVPGEIEESEGTSPALELLAALRAGGEAPRARLDRLGVPTDWPLTSVDELDSAFGGEFATSLEDLPVGRWSGPVRSGYGWHLVLVEAREAPALPDLDEIRGDVEREFAYESELDAQERMFRELLGRYDVRITADVPEGVRAALGTR